MRPAITVEPTLTLFQKHRPLPWRYNQKNICSLSEQSCIRGRDYSPSHHHPMVRLTSLVIAVPSCVVRYPDGLAWQFNVPKKVLRRSPEFKKFHSFLVHETEVVSLIFYDNILSLLHAGHIGKHITAGGSKYGTSALHGRPAAP